MICIIIAPGIPPDQIDYDRVYLVAKKAQIDKTIESFPLLYHTRVGERGIQLSGGQRQRIGIARALYRQVDVIILDEATSALDSMTEFDVMQSIKNIGNDVTVIVVAHRLSTLENCTQVIELLDGKIARSGSYAEMVKAYELDCQINKLRDLENV